MSDWNLRKVFTESGIITTKPAQLTGWTARVSADSAIQIFTGTAEGSDADIISELDILEADKSGGVMNVNVVSTIGLYIKITGNARVCVYYQKPGRG